VATDVDEADVRFTPNEKVTLYVYMQILQYLPGCGDEVRSLELMTPSAAPKSPPLVVLPQVITVRTY